MPYPRVAGIIVSLVLASTQVFAGDWRTDDSECGSLIRWMQSYKNFPAGRIMDARPVKDWKLSRCKMAPEIKKGFYLTGACEGEVMPENKGIFFWIMRSRKMGASDFIDEGRYKICR